MKWGWGAQHVSSTTKIRKGKYKWEEVALKVLRVSRDNPLPPTVKSVSVPHDSRMTVFFGVILMCGTGTLPGSSFDQATQK